MPEIDLKDTVATATKTFFAGKAFVSDEEAAEIKTAQGAGTPEAQVLRLAQEDKREPTAGNPATAAADDKTVKIK